MVSVQLSAYSLEELGIIRDEESAGGRLALSTNRSGVDLIVNPVAGDAKQSCQTGYRPAAVNLIHSACLLPNPARSGRFVQDARFCDIGLGWGDRVGSLGAFVPALLLVRPHP